ncbi:MAG: hypothetical protein JXJ04_21005 [Spirochaetales bacterium]|nr:hypothetical protein [Spirochaetales bacterium]
MELKDNRLIKKIILILLALILAHNMIVHFILNKNKTLCVDEFQHAHIAWNINNGKILYKDFFEHHGAFYSLVNGNLFKLLNLAPGISTLYFLKFMNLFLSFFIIGITFAITKKITKSTIASLFAITLLTSNIIYVKFIVQIRPDTLQNLMFLAGVYVFMNYLENKKKKYGMISGIFFSLSLEANSKTLLLFFMIFLFYLFLIIVHRKKIREILVEIVWIIPGFIIAKIPFIIYFAFHSALFEYFYYNFSFNFILKQFLTEPLLKNYLGYYSINLFGFSFIVLAGYYFLFIYIANKLIPLKEKINYYLLFFLSLSFPLILILELYEQSHLMSLPLLSIVGAIGFMNIGRILINKVKISARIFLFVHIIIIFLTLNLNSWTFIGLEEDKKLTDQKKVVNYIMDNTTRDTPVPFYGGYCGGYVFNEDPHYYWFPYLCNDTRDLIHYATGEDVYGDITLTLLKKIKTPYLLFEDDKEYRTISPGVKTFIYNHYIQMTGYKNLWKRKG